MSKPAMNAAFAEELISEVSRRLFRGWRRRWGPRTRPCAFVGRFLRRQDPRSSALDLGLRAVVAHLRPAAGQAGPRTRTRLGALAGGALLLDGGRLRGLCLLLVGEDLVL